MSFPELLHINVPSRLWEWEKSTEHIFFVTWFSDLVFTVTLDLHRHHLGSVRVTFVCFLLFLHRLSLSPSGPSVFFITCLTWSYVTFIKRILRLQALKCGYWEAMRMRNILHYSVYTVFSGFAENMQFSCWLSCCRSVCKHKNRLFWLSGHFILGSFN